MEHADQMSDQIEQEIFIDELYKFKQFIDERKKIKNAFIKSITLREPKPLISPIEASPNITEFKNVISEYS